MYKVLMGCLVSFFAAIGGLYAGPGWAETLSHEWNQFVEKARTVVHDAFDGEPPADQQDWLPSCTREEKEERDAKVLMKDLSEKGKEEKVADLKKKLENGESNGRVTAAVKTSSGQMDVQKSERRTS